MRKITITEIDLDELLQHVRSIIKEEIKAEAVAELQEKMLSPEETLKLFQPAITKPTLSAWTNAGHLKKYHLGGRTWYKYSEVMEAAKHISRYKKPQII